MFSFLVGQAETMQTARFSSISSSYLFCVLTVLHCIFVLMALINHLDLDLD